MTLNLNQPYFKEQLITCIGNKRRLTGFISDKVDFIKSTLAKDKLIIFDGFAGSGATARIFKYYSELMFVNDLEHYSYIVNKCHLANKSDIDIAWLKDKIKEINFKAKSNLIHDGFIAKNYAPEDDDNIQNKERVFYTSHNAKMIDTIKHLVNSEIKKEERYLFLAPLIVKASIHTNTSGVFKGFHKSDGVGMFGGAGKNALSRILKPIELEMPVFSSAECPVNILQKDTNEAVRELPELDLAYYDPPYNQHPYGSNYFMLNILARSEPEVAIQNGVSGITREWNRSAYNKRDAAVFAFEDLIEHTNAKYILLSYNNEGIVSEKIISEILKKYGTVEKFECDYNAYRGSRNLKSRKKHVKELLWILKKY